MKLKLKKSKTFSDKTGDLIPFYKNESLLNFNIKRFFFVYGNKRYFRADHAHKKCNQVLIPINGTIEVCITNKNKKERKFLLSLRSNNYLFVPKDHWIKLTIYALLQLDLIH